MEYPLVLVHWLDHESNGGPEWEDLESQLEWAAELPPIGQTVGWIIWESEKHIVLVDTIMNSTETGTAHKILKDNIVFKTGATIMDERLAKLRDMLIDSTIEYLKEEISDKSINSARAVLKDLAPREDIELSKTS